MSGLCEHPCFVKLSARSCKDSILRSSHFKAVLRSEVERFGQAKKTANDLLLAYVRAQCFALRRDGSQAMEDFLESRRSMISLFELLIFTTEC